MKYLTITVLSVLCLIFCGRHVYPEEQKSMKIAMIIPKDNFRDEELLIPKSVFEKAGLNVVVFSTSGGKATGMLGGTFNVEHTIGELNLKDYNAVVFVGGSGAEGLFDNKDMHRIAINAVKDNKVLGAICIAPIILARAGVLKGKRATVFYSEGGELKKEGAVYTGDKVAIDSNIVTADGPNSAGKFAEAVLGLIK